MKSPILEAVELSKSFTLKKEIAGTGQKKILRAVDTVSISVMQGETLGIAGESGCGKSTLAKMMAGLLEPGAGTVRYMDVDIKRMRTDSRKSFRKSVQMIFQDPFSSLNPRIRIGDAIAEPLLIHGLCQKHDLNRKVSEIMKQTGLSPELYNRFPHEFSGGQRQRIVIARALAASPSFLVADEPVSSLDISIQAQIINLLLEMRQKHGLTMMMISHNMGVLKQMCDNIAVMYLGRIVETAPAEAIFRRCRHPYTAALLAATPSTKKKKGEQEIQELTGDTTTEGSSTTGCAFHPRCQFARDICQTTVPDLISDNTGHLVACHLSKELYDN